MRSTSGNKIKTNIINSKILYLTDLKKWGGSQFDFFVYYNCIEDDFMNYINQCH